jgi:hypothetical protein
MHVRLALLCVAVAWVACSNNNGATPTTDAGAEEPAVQPLPPTTAPACAQTAPEDLHGYSPTFSPRSSGDVERDKAFYLTTVLDAAPGLRAAILADPTLGPIAADREARLRGAPAKCGTTVACYADALRWSDTDVAAVAQALPKVATTLAKDELRPSGAFMLRASLADDAMTSAAWQDTAAALDATYDNYAAALDGATLQTVVTSAAKAPSPMAFFEPILRVDLAALVAQQRDEATRYEPLTTTNAAALGVIKTMKPADWAGYPYTVILVPGLGPTDLSTPISAGGQQRCDMAAARFAAHFAPFIMVSGGHVHPDRTPYSEAIQMRKYLEEKYGIPEAAILVDPHARHTTTNLRNASRELYRYGIPTDRVVLVTSDLYQSAYMAYWDGDFGPRNVKELGYMPWRALAPLSPTDTCLLPSAVSLELGSDPLDP